jgi:hypothetical protein
MDDSKNKGSSLIEVYSHMCGPSDEAADRNWEGDNLIQDIAETHGVKRVNFLTPLPSSDPSWSLRRQIKYSVDHTLYLYPQSLDKFDQRFEYFLFIYLSSKH